MRNILKPIGRKLEGFTLLELLVSAVILAVIVVLLMGMSDHSSKLWNQSENKRLAGREARAALEIISEDLHNAVITSNPDTLLISTQGKGKGDRLFFLTSHPSEKRNEGIKGDLCAIGYFVSDDPKHQETKNLYRFHLSGTALTNAFENDQLGNLYATATATNSELLARNIVQLDLQRLVPPSADPLLRVSISASAVNAGVLKKSPPPLRYSTIVRLPDHRHFPNGS
jgi:prepilin-type N-terminal cleavage/methylation domain-containing protein